MVYNFSKMILNLSQGLTYQNDPFHTDCLVLLHTVSLLFIVWNICCVSSFVCFFSELRSFHSFTKCFIYVRLSIASKCLNLLWCVVIKRVYKFLLEIWVACWENFLRTHKADHTWFFQIPLILTASSTDKFFEE